jgi:hypothetical protein
VTAVPLRFWRWRLALVSVLLCLGRPPTGLADSLVDVPTADLAQWLGGREAHPLTRRVELLYPAPGLPAVVAPGEEVVLRLRVRRAMTPPPGVQQLHVLAGWQASLTTAGLFALPNTTGLARYEVPIVQIRPEDEGFVYRIRLRVPPLVPPAVYDLELTGPGVAVRRPRVVRVWPANGAERWVAVLRGDRLWHEAELLWLLDPVALLVPGLVGEGSRVLAQWPLATFAVARGPESVAHRCLTLGPDVTEEVLRATGCLESTVQGRARCVADALGPDAFDDCGDGLRHYVRRHGPPAYRVALDGLTLRGLLPGPERELLPWLHLGHSLSSPSADQVMVRSGRHPRWRARYSQWVQGGRWEAGPRVTLQDEAGQPVVTFEPAGTAGSGAALDPAVAVSLPAVIFWRPAPAMEPWPDRPATRIVQWQREPTELSVEVQRPWSGKTLHFPFLVPRRRGGWQVSVEGGTGRVTAVFPARGDLCRLEEVIVVFSAVADQDRLLRVTAKAGRHPLPAKGPLVARPASPVVGRRSFFEFPLSETGGDSGAGPSPTALGPVVFWDLGDGATRIGSSVQHRYLRSGREKVCAVRLDRFGRVEHGVADIFVTRPGEASTVARLAGPVLVGMGGVSWVLLGLLLRQRGNIWGPGRR